MPIVTGPGVSSFKNLNRTAAFELLGLADLMFPADRMVLFFYSADAQMGDLRIEVQSADGWERVVLETNTAVEWEAVLNKMVPAPFMIITDGVNFRLKNSGGSPISGISYWYMPV